MAKGFNFTGFSFTHFFYRKHTSPNTFLNYNCNFNYNLNDLYSFYNSLIFYIFQSLGGPVRKSGDDGSTDDVKNAQQAIDQHLSAAISALQAKHGMFLGKNYNYKDIKIAD